MRLAHELLETWAPAKLPQPGVCRGEREPGTGPTSERAFPGGAGEGATWPPGRPVAAAMAAPAPGIAHAGGAPAVHGSLA